jgi:diguanylate cyclase (GGDEF)-like protein
MSPLENYCGKILNGRYSRELKERLQHYITVCRSCDSIGIPVIPYISAWQENVHDIWYEFVGGKFCRFLNCTPISAVDMFRKAVIDRRVYHYLEVETKIQEQILLGPDLQKYRPTLREEGKKTGGVEAVYKIAAKNDQIVWLKDRATIETYGTDGICLSLGSLTDVTKEMEQKSLLEKVGYFDELTGLPNRTIMYRIIEINISQLQRRSITDFIFLMLDIDHFKTVNDIYGHQAGDYVLSTLAEVMSSTKRKGDEIGRYGGEEFYGLTHGNSRSGWDFAERLRSKVEKTPFVYNGRKIHVTISIGLVTATELPDLQADTLIRLADKRLYTAKQQGRNRVIADNSE